MAEEKKEITVTGPQLVQMLEAERAKLQNIESNLANLRTLMGETEAAIATIDIITKGKKDEKILVSLGAAMYAEASMPKKTLKKMLAGRVLLNSSPENAKQDLNKRLDEMKKTFESAAKEHQQGIANINNLTRMLEAGKRMIAQKKAQGAQQKAEK